MEKSVFKAYMREEIIQKSIIFGQAFNLTINSWGTKRNDEKHPFRIYFYADKEYVGFVDAGINKYGDTIFVKGEHPFVFYTPLGKVEGTYRTGYNQAGYFSFVMPIKNAKLDSLDGLIEVGRTGLDKKYIFGAMLSFYKDQKLVTKLNVGDTSLSNLFEVQRYEAPYDMVSFGHSLNIRHTIAENHELVVMSKAKIHMDTMECRIWALDHDSYAIPLQCKEGLPEEASIIMKPRYLDLEPVYEELVSVDPTFFKAVDATRDDLVFKANGITPVNLYDIMTSMAYSNSLKYVTEFAHTKDTGISFEDNLVLKRMREKEKEFLRW